MENEHRGELTVTVGGRDFLLRPEFESIARLESHLNLGLPHIVMRMARDPRYTDFAAVIFCSMVTPEGEKAPSFKEVGKLVMKTKIMSITKPLCDFLGKCLSAGEEEIDEMSKKGALKAKPTV